MTAHSMKESVYSATDAKTPDSAWASLYKIGAVAALIAVVFFRRNLGAEASLLTGQTPPVTAGDWFALLQTNSLLGLTFLGVFDVVNGALLGLMLLAVYPALRRANESYTRIALALGLVGVGVYFASNQAFSMLALSHQFAAAATDTQRAGLLAAGEALLAISGNGTGNNLSLLSVTLAGLLISVVMLRSVFSKTTAYAGILAHVLVLGYFMTLIFAPALTFLPHTAAAIPLIVWEFMTARKLLQLGR